MRRRTLEQRLDQMPVRIEQRELAVGDRSVTFGMLIPKAPPPDGGYPLIVGLHYGTTQEPGLSPYFGLGYVGQLVYPALQDVNAVIVAPDAPEASWAHPASEHAVLAVIASVKKELAIDDHRTLVTGFSMGGQGAWFFAATHPELFTAAIPMTAMPLTVHASSRDDVRAALRAVEQGSEWATPLLKMPLYVIQSRADQTVPAAAVERAVQTLKGRGGDVTLVLIDDIAHNMIPGFIDPLNGAIPWIHRTWGD